MVKIYETRWTCCNELISRVEKNSILIPKFLSRKTPSPIVYHQRGRCPECVKTALELGAEERAAHERSNAEARRKVERRAGRKTRKAMAKSNGGDVGVWEPSTAEEFNGEEAGPRRGNFSFEEESELKPRKAKFSFDNL